MGIKLTYQSVGLQNIIRIRNKQKGVTMRYNDQTLNPALVDNNEIIPNIEEVDKEESNSTKKVKAHVIRRNVEDYLERKALERSLKEVFDDEYLLD